MVKCPFCKQEMQGPSTAILSSIVRATDIYQDFRKSWRCSGCRVMIERIITVKVPIP